MNILGTGLSGLVGSRVVELLQSKFEFENLSLETGVDITDESSVNTYFTRSDAPWVFHFAAYTDVQGAEKEKTLGEQSIAWKVNVLATEHIVENCRKQKRKLVYIDTDYAFDGTKATYAEDDVPNPMGWYAKTKAEGAKRVLSLGDLGVVIRISNPYRAHPVGKKDFVHKMLERLQNNQEIMAPSDQLFVPTFIDDIAHALDAIISRNAQGIYHVVGASPLSPHEAAMTIAQIFGLSESLVHETTFAEMFKDRAPVPKNAVLTSEKLKAIGVQTKSFREGISEMKHQEI